MGWFGQGSKDERETEKLLAEAQKLKATSLFQSREDVRIWISALLAEVCDESDLDITALVATPLGNIVWRLLEREAFLFDDDIEAETATLKEGVVLRSKLRTAIMVLSREAHFLAIWRDAIKALLLALVQALPVNALTDPYPDGTVEEVPALHPSVPLYELVDNLPLILTQIMGTLCASDLAEAGLFTAFSLSVDRRLCVASGIPWNERHSSKRKVQLPIERADMKPSELVLLYTEGTLFEAFFQIGVPVPVPHGIRFEHMHIVGGTGHGKTQLLQYLIMDDLSYALDHPLSLVVIDPDGTLIKTVTHTDYFGEYLYQDRAIFIDPSDIDFPIELNLFDTGHIAGDARTRETIENNTIELFEYFFDALLGSELTGKQSTLFRYLGLLLMQIPGGNIHTLRELMEDGKQYKPYMEQLRGSAKVFFETRFFAPDLKATKSQVLSRLWGVLSNRALDRILSSTRNSVNFDQALQDGSMIFIHTSKEYLGEEGSHIFARLMVALLGQALIRRAAVAPDARTPAYIYIDEAEGVVDQTLVRLLAQARKYKGAITLAHQHLDQLTASSRAGILANTSIKLAGGVSVKDAGVLAAEMRTKPDFILDQRKKPDSTYFALFAKNITQGAMTFEVPLGYAENSEQLTSDEYEALIESSRERYAQPLLILEDGAAHEPSVQIEAVVQVSEVPRPAAAPTDITAPIIKKSGGGGARHSEIERFVQEHAEAAGFRVTLEETILGGLGRADVILRKHDLTICCEVSVTTTREHELLNVKKCLEYGADHVWLIANTERHKVSLERHIRPVLSESESKKTSIMTPDEVPILLALYGVKVVQGEKVVRGWRVSSQSP
jgi:hypothetical protein